MTTLVGIRELRNRTTEVIAAVERGEEVHLTKHGRVIASVVPARVVPSDDVADFLASVHAHQPYDSGLAEFVRRERDAELDPDRWA